MAAVLDAPTAASPGLPELRTRFRDGKAALLEHFRASRPTAPAAATLIRALGKHVDETLVTLWNHAAMPPGTALLAVGGYGRGELFPHSDVDVLVLLPPSLAGPALKASIEAFITACWDIGLEIGSSVRSVGECIAMAKSDVTVQTALLESRYLCGSRRVFASFRHANTQAMDPKAFLRAKTLEMLQRHRKFEDTPYALEPNCKESPGGLRDLQVVIWVARAAGLGKTWAALAAKGLITPFEEKQLHRNEGLLKLIRARLHMIAGRREDRLVFDLQTAVADSFGYHGTHGQRASEVLMKRYYWAAKAVTQLNQILMLNIEERIEGSQDAPMRPINEKFLERGGMLEVASDDLYQRDPHAILETFLVYQQTIGPKGLSARTLRALYNARDLMDAKFRHDPVNRAIFMKILKSQEGQTHAFRLMNQTSVLGRYLWVFRRIVGQMQHDLFHVYTVDQHIIMVLRNVRRFFIPEHTHEYPFCSQLASSFDRPWVLYIAALFHDVAKGRGGDHSELGAVEARRFCKDHLVGGEDAALIEFLVEAHLTMSRIAQKEDLSDPDVIEAFAKLVGNERTLTALYLLTVADIRGTSPKVWNAWKGKLLEDLYRLTLRALGGARPNMDAEVEARKLEARQMLNLASLAPGVQ
ncbi:MAG: [protein-PII] uridylyltransferase, partial [Rhizobiales bacterium]|nr:[protein-PII] uridylyltransferase [Rhizobacter sp.]